MIFVYTFNYNILIVPKVGILYRTESLINQKNKTFFIEEGGGAYVYKVILNAH